jgi:hypothetical protein
MMPRKHAEQAPEDTRTREMDCPEALLEASSEVSLAMLQSSRNSPGILICKSQQSQSRRLFTLSTDVTSLLFT